MEEKPKNNSKWQIFLPIIIALVLAGVFFYLDSVKNSPEEPGETTVEEGYKIKEPVSVDENPRRNESLVPGIGCAGPENLIPTTLKEPDAEWTITPEGSTQISLGKYRILAPDYALFDIPKLWLYFLSKDLSDRDDDLYGVEASYISNIKLLVNGQERNVNLGGSEYMFIELGDYPLGDLYPYDEKVAIDFEFFIELNCNNKQGDKCLDNSGNPLENINGKDIEAHIRIFGVGCQEFMEEISINSKFKY